MERGHKLIVNNYEGKSDIKIESLVSTVNLHDKKSATESKSLTKIELGRQ